MFCFVLFCFDLIWVDFFHFGLISDLVWFGLVWLVLFQVCFFIILVAIGYDARIGFGLMLRIFLKTHSGFA